MKLPYLVATVATFLLHCRPGKRFTGSQWNVVCVAQSGAANPMNRCLSAESGFRSISSAAYQLADVDGGTTNWPFVTQCMDRPCVARGNVETGGLRSCVNVSGLRVERLVLRASMGIRAHPISLPDRPRGAVWVTSVRMRRRDRSSIISSVHLADLGGELRNCFAQATINPFLSSCVEGALEVIPSEPPSLARPNRRATVAEGGWRPSPW